MEQRNRRTAASIVYDAQGYRYREKSRHAGKRTYVCCETERLCPGKACSTIDGNIVCTTNHNHVLRADKIACELFKDQLWQAVVTTDDDFRRIYNRIALNNIAAARAIPFIKIERSMKRWRHVPHPPIPATLFEYGELINAERWRNFREDQQVHFVVRTRVIDRESSVTVIGDPEFLATVQNIQILYVDATFKVCPRRPRKLQLVTIMGKIDETPMALGWILMNRRTGIAYRRAFEIFRDEFAPHFHPTVFHADFEQAIGNAMRAVYPNIVEISCYFHHAHAIYNRLLREGGRANLDILAHWDLAKVYYRKLITLAFLPPANIIPAFMWLLNNTPPDIMRFFGNLFIYYADTWLRIYGPQRFSMYRVNERTNNYIESYHRTLCSLLGTHPDIWKFTIKLKNLQTIIKIEVDSLNRGLPVRRPITQRYRNREIVLNHMWELLDNGELTIPRFLACANHVSEAFENNMIIATAADVDRFIVAPTHNINIQPPHIQIGEIILEGFGERDPIPILPAHPAGGPMNFFILEDMQQSLCTRCRSSILSIMTLPCQHWFLCKKCTEAEALACAAQQRLPTCLFCHHDCTAFQAVQIS